MFSTTAPPSSCDQARMCSATAVPNASLRATTSAGAPAVTSAESFFSSAAIARCPVGPVLEKKFFTANASAASVATASS